MKNFYRLACHLLALAALFLSALPASAAAPLFERLGGIGVVEAVASELVDSVSSDARTRRTFEGINLVRLKGSVAAHLCRVSGGHCKYAGDSMATVHAGMNLSDDEFNIMADYLGQALQRHGVPQAEQQELGAILSAMRPEIVGK